MKKPATIFLKKQNLMQQIWDQQHLEQSMRQGVMISLMQDNAWIVSCLHLIIVLSGSAQYILALRDFTDPENPKRFKFGFMGSSDNHNARPGTGYKELFRNRNTEARGGQILYQSS